MLRRHKANGAEYYQVLSWWRAQSLLHSLHNLSAGMKGKKGQVRLLIELYYALGSNLVIRTISIYNRHLIETRSQ